MEVVEIDQPKAFSRCRWLPVEITWPHRESPLFTMGKASATIEGKYTPVETEGFVDMIGPHRPHHDVMWRVMVPPSLVSFLVDGPAESDRSGRVRFLVSKDLMVETWANIEEGYGVTVEDTDMGPRLCWTPDSFPGEEGDDGEWWGSEWSIVRGKPTWTPEATELGCLALGAEVKVLRHDKVEADPLRWYLEKYAGGFDEHTYRMSFTFPASEGMDSLEDDDLRSYKLKLWEGEIVTRLPGWGCGSVGRPDHGKITVRSQKHEPFFEI
jgi:hypothetical protein